MPSPASAYVASLKEPIRHGIANAIEWNLLQLDEPLSRSTKRPDTDMLLGLLERAVSWDAPLSALNLHRFVNQLLRVMAAEGPGMDFRRQDDFVFAVEKAINKLASLGSAVSDLHLELAAYYSNIANNGPGRRAAIEAAIASSQGSYEHLRSLLTLAQFLIDISKYARARRILDECLGLVPKSSRGVSLIPAIYMTRGMSYFYNNHRHAEQWFEKAIRAAGELPPQSVVDSAVTTSYHYLGRIRAAQGRWEEALSLMTYEGHSAHSTYGSEAFKNLRIAEVLMEAKAISEARYHLRVCSELFRSVQQASTGQVQLDTALARLQLMEGDRRGAETLLRNAAATARQHSYSRGELRCLVELLRLHLSHASLLPAVAAGSRGLILFLRSEVRGGGFRFLAGIRAITTFMPTRTRRSSRPEPAAYGSGHDIHCPCGAHHELPARRSGREA